jgi:hypothetical protein
VANTNTVAKPALAPDEAGECDILRALDEQIKAVNAIIALVPADSPLQALQQNALVTLQAQRVAASAERKAAKTVAQRRAEVLRNKQEVEAKLKLNETKLQEAEDEVLLAQKRASEVRGYAEGQRKKIEDLQRELRELAAREASEMDAGRGHSGDAGGDITDEEKELERRLVYIRTKRAAHATADAAMVAAALDSPTTHPRKVFERSSDALLGESRGRRARSYSPNRVVVANKWAALQESRPC